MKSGFLLLQLFFHSDLLSKIIVFLLLFSSTVVFFFQWYLIIILNKKGEIIKSDVRIFSSQDQSVEALSPFSKTLISYLNSSSQIPHEQVKEILSIIGSHYLQFEKKIQTVFSIASHSAPLIGLLGTVWGIMNAFMGLAADGGGTIAAVAPGIAEALITTLAGLVVAIPALIFYQWNRTKIRLIYENILLLIDVIAKKEK